MIPAIYENLCTACGKDLTYEEVEEGICKKRGISLAEPLTTLEEKELEEFFKKVVGTPRALQRFWIKRIAKHESFAAVAPTGIGKTTFGLATALFFALKKQRCYIIVPTTLLVNQSVEILEKFCKILGIEMGINEKRKLTVAFYYGKMRKQEKERFQERIKAKDYDILVTTAQFLTKNFSDLKGIIFDFIFVDDVDAILKNSRNVDKVLILLGFRRIKDRWLGQAKGTLMVSTATAKKGRSTILFRELLNFDVGSSFFSIRNIEDIALNTEDLAEIKKVLKKMGKGGILYARSVEEAEKFYHMLKDEFRIGLVVSKENKGYELFEKGELDYLIGTSYYYGLLIRGLDLPEKIRYVVFIGAPLVKISFDKLTPRILKVLALAFRKNEEVKRYLHLIPNIEKHPKEAEELREIIRRICTKEKTEDLIVSSDQLMIPDIRTYIQGSGRASRLTISGLTYGASFLFEKDKRVLQAFVKRASYYNISFKSLAEVSFDKLIQKIDSSRKKKKVYRDLIKPALFVVESPTKAKLIARFFGKPSVKMIANSIAYEVATEKYILLITACLGHVVDLVTDRGFHGVLTAKHFVPIYATIKRCKQCGYQFTKHNASCPKCGSTEIDDSKERIEALRNLASETGLVIIATDPDAEGEKIAWDLANLFSGIAEVKRAEFHEVTPQAIRKALNELRAIDENRVKAQIVRRIEDRWIGFVLTEKLWQAFRNRNLSAGRVQTPVLKWIIEQEAKFRRRKKLAYSPELGLSFENISDKELEIGIELLSDSEEKRSPLPPYTTDEMLKDANRILKMHASTCMALAQDLFESGLITYHRTDSTYVSDAGLRIAEEYLGKDFKARRWSAKQGAHECIRPTRPWDKTMLQRMIYEKVIAVENISAKHLALYDLIFRRFIASQCKELAVRVKRYRISYNNKRFLEERVIDVKGKAYELYRSIKKGKELPLGKIRVKLRFLFVPEAYPYTQADVVRLMKERSIGRPSTYATIVEKLFARGYILERKHMLFPTFLGKKVCYFLMRNYSDFVSEERTRMLLEKMDLIENAQADYAETLREIYREIKSIAKQTMNSASNKHP